jgi:hypothetical protein
MDPTARVLLIGRDVTVTMTSVGIQFDNDLSKRFGPDLNMNLGSFQGLLNQIQNTINGDKQLHLVVPFDWKKISPAPTGETFSQFFLVRSINSLILGIDGIVSHSPFLS